MSSNQPSGFFASLQNRFRGSEVPKSLSPSAGANKMKKYILLGSFMAIGYLVYINVFSKKVEIICMETDVNLKLTRKITELRTQKYTRSALLPFRFMEIVYGNIYDTREYCDYTREILTDPDGENLALGKLTRLGVPPSGHRFEPQIAQQAADSRRGSGFDRRRRLRLHHVG